MQKWLIKILVCSVNVFVLAYILPGVEIVSFFTAIVVAVVLSLLDAFVKPLLVLFTLPATILTLGLFLFVINAFIIIIADKFIDGIRIDGFFWALLFSLILSIFSAATNKAMKEDKRKS